MSERRLLINVASLKKSSIVVGDEVVDVDGSEETPLSTSTNSSLLVPFADKNDSSVCCCCSFAHPGRQLPSFLSRRANRSC